MTLDLMQKMRWKMQVTAEIFGRNQRSWQGYKSGVEGLECKLLNKDEGKFYRKGKENEAYIIISNLQPVKISKTTYGPAILLNTDTKDSYSSVCDNNSDSVEITRSYEITEGQSTSWSNDLGVSVGIEISQSVGYGGDLYGVQGETSITASIEASFSHQWGGEDTTERTIGTEITIPPKTRTTLTATKSVSRLKQDVTYISDLEFSMKFMNWGDVAFEIESQVDLKKLIKGEDYPGLVKPYRDEAQGKIDDIIRGRKQYLGRAEVGEVVTSEFTKSIEFDKTVTGSVVLNSEEIR